MPQLSPSSTSSVSPGYVVVHMGADVWAPFSQVGATGGEIGVAVSTAIPGGTLQVISFGDVPVNVFNIGAGPSSNVYAVGNTPARGSAGTLVGTCDTSGKISVTGNITGTTVPPTGLISVKSNGAYGNGTNADQAAVQRADSAATLQGPYGATVYFPPGTYLITTNFTTSSNVRYKFDPGASLSIAAGVTFTFLSPIDAHPTLQIFSGAGIVQFSKGSQPFVNADWWGTSGLQAAVTAASVDASGNQIGIEVRLNNSSTYDLGSGATGLNIPYSNTRIIGNTESADDPTYITSQTNGPLITYEGTGTAIQVGSAIEFNPIIYNVRLENFRLQATNACQFGLWTNQVAASAFKRIRITGPGGTTTTAGGSGGATDLNRVCLRIGNAVNCVYEQINCDGSAGGGSNWNNWGTALSMAYGVSTTTTTLKECYFHHSYYGAWFDSAFAILYNCVFEGCATPVTAFDDTQLLLDACWWEDCGGSGGVGGTTIAANGFFGPSMCAIDATSYVTIQNAFCNCYSGQNYLFALTSTAKLRVKGGQIRFTNNYVNLSSSTVTSPITVTLATPVYIGNCNMAHGPFYLQFTGDGGNTGILPNSATVGIWQVDATSDTVYTLHNQEGINPDPGVSSPAYFAKSVTSTGAGSGGSANSCVSAVPFLFAGFTESTTMDVEIDGLLLTALGAPCQIYPPTGGFVGESGDSFTWRSIDFKRNKQHKVNFVGSIAANATTTLSLDSAYGGNTYCASANGWILGCQVLYNANINSTSSFDLQILRTINGTDYVMLDTGSVGSNITAGTPQNFDKAFMTTPVVKGDYIKVKVTSSATFTTANANMAVEVRLAEGSCTQ